MKLSPSTATRLEAGGGGIGILCRVICGLGTDRRQEPGARSQENRTISFISQTAVDDQTL